MYTMEVEKMQYIQFSLSVIMCFLLLRNFNIQKQKRDDDSKQATIYRTLILLAFCFLLLAIASPIILFKYNELIPNPESLGQKGDFMAGTTTPLLNIVNAILLFATFQAQKQMLKDQKKEFAETRMEFKQQNETMSRQRFENTFFQMITLHHQIVNALEISREHSGEMIIRKGRQYFEGAYTFLQKPSLEEFPTNEQYLYKLISLYIDFYHSEQDQLGHYFRNFYHILKFIDKSPELQTKDEKQFYASILRAQLSSYELTLLLYNCIGQYANKKLRPLMVEYNMFQNINTSLLKNEDRDFKLYKNLHKYMSSVK